MVALAVVMPLPRMPLEAQVEMRQAAKQILVGDLDLTGSWEAIIHSVMEALHIGVVVEGLALVVASKLQHTALAAAVHMILRFQEQQRQAAQVCQAFASLRSMHSGNVCSS
ncbi:hypothetical protein WP3S18E05_16400 [Klebsiella sp. WP3-S18-ESBL-05]|nr:hypothetical protein WP3S18E05_16400 [Klebsiella sp. WP3-S18-ESBL-05]